MPRPKRLKTTDITIGNQYFLECQGKCFVVVALRLCLESKDHVVVQNGEVAQSVPVAQLSPNNFKISWSVSRWSPFAKAAKKAATRNGQEFSWLDY